MSDCRWCGRGISCGGGQVWIVSNIHTGEGRCRVSGRIENSNGCRADGVIFTRLGPKIRRWVENFLRSCFVANPRFEIYVSINSDSVKRKVQPQQLLCFTIYNTPISL